MLLVVISGNFSGAREKITIVKIIARFYYKLNFCFYYKKKCIAVLGFVTRHESDYCELKRISRFVELMTIMCD